MQKEVEVGLCLRSMSAPSMGVPSSRGSWTTSSILTTKRMIAAIRELQGVRWGVVWDD